MKPVDKITAPDERQTLVVGTLLDLHAGLAEIRLHPSVPDNVRDLFDTALNLSLYSWFVYDFHPVADLTGFLAMEAALRTRASQDNETLANKPLKTLMKHAIAAGWLAEDRITGRRELARARVQHRKSIQAIEAEASTMTIIQSMCIAAVDLRNALAHGERMLVPDSYQRLRTTADLIHQLFPPPWAVPRRRL